MWRGSLVVNSGTIDVCVHPPIADLREETLGEQVADIHKIFARTLAQSQATDEGSRRADGGLMNDNMPAWEAATLWHR